MSLDIKLPDEAATLRLGEALAQGIAPGRVIHLRGELGAGKTTLARGLLHALGYAGRIKSPTYAVVEPYSLSRLNLYHFDFYRFKDPHEWIDAGFRDAFEGDNVCVVEWPEKVGQQLPTADLIVELEHAGAGREATITAQTEAGKRCVQQLSG